MDYLLRSHPLKDLELDALFPYISLVGNYAHGLDEVYVESFQMINIYKEQIFNHPLKLTKEQLESSLKMVKGKQLQNYVFIDIAISKQKKNKVLSENELTILKKAGNDLFISSKLADSIIEFTNLVLKHDVNNLESKIKKLTVNEKQFLSDYIQDTSLLTALGKKFLESKNEKEALFWFEKGAGFEDADALFELGEMYYFGTSVEKNPEEAMEYYRRSAVQGHKDAENRLGYIYSEEFRNYERANYWFESAIKHGSASGRFNLGFAYLDGNGVPKNEKKAFELVLQSAKMDDVEAQNAIGVFYYKGIGVSKNQKEALNWSLKAAQEGHLEAQYGAGIIYDELEEPENAMIWLKKAAERGHQGAAERLHIVEVMANAKKELNSIIDEYNRSMARIRGSR